MVLKRFYILPLMMVVIVLGACESRALRSGQYWQRISASEAAYIQGPKAQQMLERDIARCVVELRELERLNTLRNAIPTDLGGRVQGPDERQLSRWDTPAREGDLLAEHSDYQDFEGCMLAAGWERILHVPYDVAERARLSYIKAHQQHAHQSRYQERNLRRPGASDNTFSGTLNE